MERRTPTGLWLDFFFTARAWEGETRNLEPGKCERLEWLQPSEPGISDYVAQALQQITARQPFSAYDGM